MTYRDGVYDITEYLTKHPGGKLILQAAGGPVDMVEALGPAPPLSRGGVGAGDFAHRAAAGL